MLKINLKRLLLPLLIILLASGCGPTIPKSELHDLPPLMEIVSLNLNEKQLKLRLTHRNKRIRQNNQLSCQLALKDFTPVRFNQVQLPDLTHYAKETITINIDQKGQLNIKAEPKELAYVLDCYLYSENFRDEQIIKKSTLYKVPGTNDEYR